MGVAIYRKKISFFKRKMIADIPAEFPVVDLDEEESQPQTLASQSSSTIVMTDNEYTTRTVRNGAVIRLEPG